MYVSPVAAEEQSATEDDGIVQSEKDPATKTVEVEIAADPTADKSIDEEKQANETKPEDETQAQAEEVSPTGKVDKSSPEAELKICPDCPVGCVPVGWVESYRDGISPTEGTCPGDCVEVSIVLAFLKEPLCRMKDPEENDETEEESPDDGKWEHTLNRIVASKTAIPPSKGSFTATGYGFGIWELTGSVTDNLQLGLVTMVPVGYEMFIPKISYSGEIAEELYLGTGIFGGAFFSFMDNDTLGTPLGLHFAFTKVWNDKHVLNLFLANAIGWGKNDNGQMEFSDLMLLQPAIGYQLRFRSSWTFNIDIQIPVILDLENHEHTSSDNLTVLVFYGFRGHSELLFGDIGFIMPLSKRFIRSTLKYAPLGLPYFSLGFEI